MSDLDKVFRVQDLKPSSEIKQERLDARVEFLKGFQENFVAQHPSVPTSSHKAAYDRAVRLMRTSAAKAFDLAEEPGKLRDRYGRNLFGQGCLLARRLVERGVPFVEVTLNNAPARPMAGTRTDRTSSRSRICAPCSTPLGQPCWETLLSVACWTRRWSSGWANLAERRELISNKAATTSPMPGVPSCAAAASKAGRSTAKPAPTAWQSKTGRLPCRTSWPRSPKRGC